MKHQFFAIFIILALVSQAFSRTGGFGVTEADIQRLQELEKQKHDNQTPYQRAEKEKAVAAEQVQAIHGQTEELLTVLMKSFSVKETNPDAIKMQELIILGIQHFLSTGELLIEPQESSLFELIGINDPEVVQEFRKFVYSENFKSAMTEIFELYREAIQTKNPELVKELPDSIVSIISEKAFGVKRQQLEYRQLLVVIKSLEVLGAFNLYQATSNEIGAIRLTDQFSGKEYDLILNKKRHNNIWDYIVNDFHISILMGRSLYYMFLSVHYAYLKAAHESVYGSNDLEHQVNVISSAITSEFVVLAGAATGAHLMALKGLATNEFPRTKWKRLLSEYRELKTKSGNFFEAQKFVNRINAGGFVGRWETRLKEAVREQQRLAMLKINDPNLALEIASLKDGLAKYDQFTKLVNATNGANASAFDLAKMRRTYPNLFEPALETKMRELPSWRMSLKGTLSMASKMVWFAIVANEIERMFDSSKKIMLTPEQFKAWGEDIQREQLATEAELVKRYALLFRELGPDFDSAVEQTTSIFDESLFDEAK